LDDWRKVLHRRRPVGCHGRGLSGPLDSPASS
jgi:hypothetical protein